MTHKEIWHIEADSLERDLARLTEEKTRVLTDYVRAMSRAGKLKDLPKQQLVALAHMGALAGADLSRTSFNRSDLTGSNLRGVDFTSADLRGAQFTLCDLRDTKWNRTWASEANFQEADLSGVDMDDTYLEGSTFYLANLEGTDFRKATIDIPDLIYPRNHWEEELRGHPVLKGNPLLPFVLPDPNRRRTRR